MIFNSQIKRLSFFKIHIALILITISLLVGILGYMQIEGLSFIEALYMSIITISTVGFGEVRELSDAGRIFTVFLIITYIGIFTYSITVITSYVIDGEFKRQLKKYRMGKKIQKLENHIIVCGYGRNGQMCCEELKRHNEKYIIIERNSEVVETFSENEIFINGDATEDKYLLEANVLSAKSVISTLPNDAENVYVTLSCRKLNPKIAITSRASSDTVENKLKSAGADHVVLPEYIGGHYMAALVSRPDIIEFYHLMTDDLDTSITIDELDFNLLKQEYRHKTISDMDLRRKTGVNAIAIKTSDGKFQINPDPDTIIQTNTKLILLGNADQIKMAQSIFTDKI